MYMYIEKHIYIHTYIHISRNMGDGAFVPPLGRSPKTVGNAPEASLYAVFPKCTW